MEGARSSGGSLLDVRVCLQTFGFYVGHRWGAADALALAHRLGRPQPDFGDRSPVRRISPREPGESRPATLSSLHGLGPFPLHTETAYWPRPARYVLLRCVHPGAGERPTVVVDTHGWELDEADRRAVTNEPFRVAGRRVFLASLAVSTDSGLAWRFDRECMVPLTRGAHRALRVAIALGDKSRHTDVDWTPGLLLVVDNCRCWHGRGVASSTDKDRVLERILIGHQP